MKGRILGFDGATGAITGDDGARYSFTVESWKGERPPKGRDPVDFVAEGQTAHDIYPVGSAVADALNSLGSTLRTDGRTEGAGAPAPANRPAVVAMIAENPQLPLAALVVFTALFLPVASGLAGVIPGINGGGFTVFTLPGTLGQISDQLKAAFGSASPIAEIFSGGSGEAKPPSSGLGIAPMLAYLLWLAPLLAVWILYAGWRQKRQRIAELATGVACLCALPIVWVGQSALAAVIAALPFGGMAASTIGLHMGFGLFVLLLCGAGLIATSRGILKRVPGL